MAQLQFPQPTPRDLRIAALTLYGEARGEDAVGKLAIAWVIKNRLMYYVMTWKEVERLGGGYLFPDAYASVCLVKYQFSMWNRHNPNSRLMVAVSSRDGVYQECLRAALDVFAERVPDMTHGATHYIQPETLVRQYGRLPRWAADPLNPRRPNPRWVVWAHGRHVFFRL